MLIFFAFNIDLAKVDKYYTDGHFAYDNVYGEKATQKKSKLGNCRKFKFTNER